MKYTYSIERDNYGEAGKASSNIKKTLKLLGIDVSILRRIAVASYEAEINMIIHSYGGNITMEINDEGVVELSFIDCGPGIKDVKEAMQPGFSTASEKAREFGFGAGMGLVNIKRVSDQFQLTTSPQGTQLRIAFNL
ncbi:MAG: ATP-binding protein [Erysipelotrichaceae bacterium]